MHLLPAHGKSTEHRRVGPRHLRQQAQAQAARGLRQPGVLRLGVGHGLVLWELTDEVRVELEIPMGLIGGNNWCDYSLVTGD